MKRVSIVLASALLARAASAGVTFTTDSAAASIDNIVNPIGVSLTPVSSGLTYSLNASNFLLDGSNFDYGDIAWAYHFSSTQALTSVGYTIKGVIYSVDGSEASAYVTGDETIRDVDSFNDYGLDLGDNYLSTSSTTGQAFSVSGLAPLGLGITHGEVAKDNLFLTLSDNVRVRIDSIEQTYATPEPATLAILGVGAAAMLRRRKKA